MYTSNNINNKRVSSMDWLATTLGLLGCLLVGKGHRFGWILYASASLLWVFIAISAELYGMSVGAVLYLLLEVKGWWHHNRGRK